MSDGHSLWKDEYWLLLLQLYLSEPIGVKHVYDRGTVDLALELHIEPKVIHRYMMRLRQPNTPALQRLWERYGDHPKRLMRDARIVRQQDGFGKPEEFYKGVATGLKWEDDYKPAYPSSPLTPMMLIIILDLYFRLAPPTMVPETEEIRDLSHRLHVSVDDIVDAMECFQACDPFLDVVVPFDNPLLPACAKIWNRYGNDDPQAIEGLAAQLMMYFK